MNIDIDKLTFAQMKEIWNWDSAGLATPVRTTGDIALRGVGSGSKVSSPVSMKLLEEVKAIDFCADEAVRVIGAQKWASK